jgi:hypothetical protein
MLIARHREDFVIDYQASATIRWHLGQHPLVNPDDASIGPIIAIKDVTIQPDGVFHARVPRDTEELLFVVSGVVTPVRDFNAGEPLPAGALIATIDGRHRGHYKLRNHAEADTARLLQILWRPYRPGLAPSTSGARPGPIDSISLVPVVVPLTDDLPPPTAVGAHQEVRCWAGALEEQRLVPLGGHMDLYVLPLHGDVMVDGVHAKDGDGVLVEEQDLVAVTPAGVCEILMIVVPSSFAGQFRWGNAKYQVAE